VTRHLTKKFLRTLKGLRRYPRGTGPTLATEKKGKQEKVREKDRRDGNLPNTNRNPELACKEPLAETEFYSIAAKNTRR